MWYQHLIKFIPGKIGCLIRNVLLPYKSGKNVLIWDGTHIDSPSRLQIGNNVSINRGCIIHAGGNVVISDNVLIGPGVVVYSQNHNYNQKDKNINLQGYNVAQVNIEENVWVGARSIILPGVSIGANSIVGAGSVVTKDVEMNTVVAGNPAKIIKKR
jgi:maltose O-acetyltransferase